ncbi:MAG: DNA-3-methyladenine glycosylase, partial [Candidatus Aenigmatarchaeota archaeon]
DLTNGPGKLTKFLRITKKFNGIFVNKKDSPIFIVEGEKNFEIASSHRIGVKKDWKRKLRFFIKGNKFISR